MKSIDEFFKEKLNEAEIKPSTEAQKRFEAALASRKKKKAGFAPRFRQGLRVAAALLVVAGIGLYFKANSPRPLLAEGTTQTVALKPNIALKMPSSSITVSPITGRAKRLEVEKTASQPAHEPQKLEEYIQERPVENAEVVFIEENQPKVAISETASSALIATPLTPVEAETLVLLSPLNEGKTEMLRTTEMNQPLVGNLATRAETDEKPLFAKVLDEIKQLKKGEKLDFNKLGFKPIDELKDGFVASEARQIKERVTWIKSKMFNN